MEVLEALAANASAAADAFSRIRLPTVPLPVIISTTNDEGTVPPVPRDNTTRLFATYLEVVKFSPADDDASADAWQLRWQWIVMPRLAINQPHVVFSREQFSKKHRPTWRDSDYDNVGVVTNEYVATVAATNAEWTAVGRAPIVVELLPHELRECVGDPTHRVTPWPVIKRARRVAKKLHGYEL